MSVYLLLFLEFFKIGTFSFGGGLATLPFLYQIADRYDWFDRAMLIDMMAIAESTPGPIGVNVATYAGFRAAGVLGGVIATFALVLPAFIIVIALTRFLAKFNDSFYVKSAFYGLRPAVVGMIASAGFSILRVSLLFGEKNLEANNLLALLNWPAIALFLILWMLHQKFKWHPVVYIGIAAVVGIAVGM